MNDSHILIGIVSVFIVMGLFLPYFNSAFNMDSSIQNFDNMESDIGNYRPTESVTDGFSIMLSVISMFFWSFNMPSWLNTLFLIPRIMIIWLIIRVVRGVG